MFTVSIWDRIIISAMRKVHPNDFGFWKLRGLPIINMMTDNFNTAKRIFTRAFVG